MPNYLTAIGQIYMLPGTHRRHPLPGNEGTPNTITITAVNLTSEFTITAADTVNNTGGTSLADSMVLVFWYDKDAA